MGQKVNPIIFRIGIIKSWNSTWFSTKKNYTKFLHQDLKIQKMIEEELKDCGIAKIEIQRDAKNAIINIHTSKPGIIIGSQGKNLDKLKSTLEKKFEQNFTINIVEVKKPDLNAKLAAENIARQIEKRISCRRACKMAIMKAKEAGALGVKVIASGRLNGVEIARDETFTEGKIPLHTLRANIDYASCAALTTYGLIGIKIWIYLGDIFKKKQIMITEINSAQPLLKKIEAKEPAKSIHSGKSKIS